MTKCLASSAPIKNVMILSVNERCKLQAQLTSLAHSHITVIIYGPYSINTPLEIRTRG